MPSRNFSGPSLTPATTGMENWKIEMLIFVVDNNYVTFPSQTGIPQPRQSTEYT